MSDNITAILVIDDVKENCDLLQRRLQADNFKVTTSLEGREGLGILKNGGVDLVLLDIDMPMMDGITLLEIIKSDDELSSIAVIMLTAIDSMKIAHECMQKGACGYLTKPFNMEQLNKQIQHCLG